MKTCPHGRLYNGNGGCALCLESREERGKIIAAGKTHLETLAPHVVKRAASQLLKEALRVLDKKCEWTPMAGRYATQCGYEWTFIERFNRRYVLTYCVFCGGKISMKDKEE